MNYICAVPVCLCSNKVVLRKLDNLARKVLRKFQYLNREKAKEISELGEKTLL